MRDQGGQARADAETGEAAAKRAGGTPLFHRIAVELRDKVVSGQLPPGARLPSEAEICEAWGVSRITAKRALDELAAEGLVTRARGRGTVVAPRAAAPAVTTRLAGWRASLARLAAETSAEVLEFGYVAAPAHVARDLELPAAAEVQRALRLRRLGGRPLALVETWLPADVGRRFSAADLAESPMLLLLERGGVALGGARESIGATAATPEAAAALGLTPGGPLVDVRRRLMDRDGRPVQLFRALYRPDLYRCEMELGADDGPGFGWRVAASAAD